MNKLDDRNFMAKIDKRQMLEELENFPLQCKAACKEGWDLDIPAGYKKIDKVLICGMGGSAIIGDSPTPANLTTARTSISVWK